jgi:hypothetical protein
VVSKDLPAAGEMAWGVRSTRSGPCGMARGRQGQRISQASAWEQVGRGSVVGISCFSLFCFFKTREMTCGWEVEFGDRNLTTLVQM